jgi:hypothetical protein
MKISEQKALSFTNPIYFEFLIGILVLSIEYGLLPSASFIWFITHAIFYHLRLK